MRQINSYLDSKTHRMTRLIIIGIICLLQLSTYGQENKKDSATLAKEKQEAAIKDSIRIENLLAKASYPLFKYSKWSGVLPVSNPSEIPDPTIKYKLLFEVRGFNKDTMVKDINISLAEIGRIINLHLASGIPQKNIEPIIVIHGPGLQALYTDSVYKSKYKVINPNDQIITDLRAIGAKFIACGQAMNFFDVKKEEMMPFVKVSVTAQTVLSHYQLKGYVLYQVVNEQ